MIGDTRFIGYCAVFKVRGEATPSGLVRGSAKRTRPAKAGLSKLNSMYVTPSEPSSSVSHDQVSVDVLVPIDEAIGRLREKPSLERR